MCPYEARAIASSPDLPRRNRGYKERRKERRPALLLIVTLIAGCGGSNELASSREPASSQEAPPASPIDGDESAERGQQADGPEPESAEPTPEAPVKEAWLPATQRLPFALELEVDSLIREGLAAGNAPGAVVLIGDAEGPIFRRAYGQRALLPERESMSAETLFDLASLTKVVATAVSVMALVQERGLDLDAPANMHLPALASDEITLRQLLTHTSGLPAVNRLSDYEQGPDQALAAIGSLPISRRRRVRYSDLNFILLGRWVQEVSGMDLDAFSRSRIFEPLHMQDTLFNPSAERLASIAPTERAPRRDGRIIRGVVHDPRAWRLGGVAGNAGLFSTIDDLSRFAAMLLSGATGSGEGLVLSADTIAAMIQSRPESPGRGLGFRVGHPILGPRAFGHGGFTGTSLWIDPVRGFYVIFLSNRVHPEGRGQVRSLIRRLHTLSPMLAAAARPMPSEQLRLGIDTLRGQEFAALEGQRVALLTHRAGRSRDGTRTLDLLADQDSFELVRIFSPEHGLGSAREGRVASAVDAHTGLDIVSLFGRQRRPTAQSLEGIDTMVVDLQDVGVRFYTYAATLGQVLQACAEADIRVMVLDRPNPLAPRGPDGPVMEERFASFVNHHNLPIEHGLSLGELAHLLNVERNLGAQLCVVPMAHWSREMAYERTGLTWVPPSPNLPDLAATRLYTSLGMLEGTNLAVGRGTDSPFQLLGAPWIDGERLRGLLGEQPGLAIEGTRFTPRASRYRGHSCRGLRFEIVDADALRPVQTGLALAAALHTLYPQRWQSARMERMLGNASLFEALMAGAESGGLESRRAGERTHYRARVATSLIAAYGPLGGERPGEVPEVSVGPGPGVCEAPSSVLASSPAR